MATNYDELPDENVLRVGPVEIGDVAPEQIQEPLGPSYDPSKPPPEEPEYGKDEMLKSAFRLYNTSVNIYDLATRETFAPVDGYGFGDVELTGYDQYSERFLRVTSPQEEQAIKKRIDQELQDKKVLENGGFYGAMASMAAGVLDPINLIPIGGAVAKANTVRGAALAAGVANAAVAGVAEAPLQMAQETRTAQEGMMSVTVAALLGSALGGGLKKLTANELDELNRQIADYIRWDDLSAAEKKAAADALYDDPGSLARLQELQRQNLIAGRGEDSATAEIHQMLLDRAAYDRAAAEAAAQAGSAGAEGVGRQVGAEGEASAATSTTTGKTSTTTRELAEDAADDEAVVVRRDPTAPMPRPTAPEDEKLYRAPLLSAMNPLGWFQGDGYRLATSLSYWANRASQIIPDDGWHRVKNVVKNMAKEENVEVQLKIEQDGLHKVFTTLDVQYDRYMRRTKGKGEFKNVEEFNRALTIAAHSGDDAADIARRVPELGPVVREVRQHLDKYAALGRRLGIFSEGTPRGAITYLPRAYNLEKISYKESEFVRELAAEFRRSTSTAIAPDGRTWEEVAQESFDTIMGTSNKHASSIFNPGLANSMKARKIDVEFSPEFIGKWIETDMETLLVNYHRSTVSRLMLAAKLDEMRLWDGDLKSSVNNFKNLIKDDYDQLKVGKSDMEAKELRDKMANDYESLDRLVARLTGSIDRGKYAQAITTTKEVMRTASLGGTLVTSVPTDLARLVSIDGFSPFASEIGQFAAATKDAFSKTDHSEILELIGPLEQRLQTRIRASGEVSDDIVLTNAISKAVDTIGRKFSKWSGMPTHNTAVKWVAGDFTMNKIIKASSKTRIDQKTKQSLAQLGIDEAMVRRIGKQWDQFASKVEGVKVPNLDQWTDKEAARRLHYAIRKNVDNVIVTPGIGGLPPFFDNALGGLIMQFKSFVFGFHNQALMVGMQQMDAAFVSSVFAMFAAGGLVVQAKEVIYGREGGKTFNEFAKNAFDASGIGGWMYEGLAMSAATQREAFGGQDLIGYVFGTPGPTQRFSNFKSPWESVVGPAPSAIMTAVMETTPDLISGDFNRADLNQFRKLIPFQNLYFMRRLFDDLENGIGTYFDLSGRMKPGTELTNPDWNQAWEEGDKTDVESFFSGDN